MWKFSLGSIQKKKKNYLIGVTVICLKKNGEWVDNLLWLCAKVLGDLVFSLFDVIWVLSKSVSEIIREWVWEFGDNDIRLSWKFMLLCLRWNLDF